MTRTVHPREILISLCILVVLAAGLFGTGYWAGHRDVDGLRNENQMLSRAEQDLFAKATDEGWFDQDEPLRVNVECHGDASDWATVRMANEIGFNADIPVFVHGNCQTHEVVDVVPDITISGGTMTCSGDLTDFECGETVKKRFGAELIDRTYCDVSTGICEKIINVPQPEGQ